MIVTSVILGSIVMYLIVLKIYELGVDDGRTIYREVEKKLFDAGFEAGKKEQARAYRK